MGIEINGYIYTITPLGLVVIGGIFIAIILFFLLILRAKKTNKQHHFFRISKWQRSQIPEILDDAINSDTYTNEEKATLKKIKKYINNERDWDINKLLNIGDKAPVLLYKVLLEETKLAYAEDNDIDSTLLLINTIDVANGLFDTEAKKYEWMDLDLVSLSDPDLPPEINVVKGLWLWIVQYMIDEQFMEEDTYLDSTYEGYDPYIIKISREDCLACVEAIEKSDGLQIDNKTADIITKFFLWYIGEIEDCSEECIADATKFYLRAVSCALDRNDYITTIDTFEP